MRGLLMVLPVLATLLTPLAPALASDPQPPQPPPQSTHPRPPPEVLETVEKNLLSLFGFRKRPRPKGKIVIPEAMVQLYKAQTGMDLDTSTLPLPGRHTRSANTVRSFPHKESGVDATFRRPDRFRLWFDVASIPREERLQAAELQLGRQPLGRAGRLRVQVHDIVRPGVRGVREPITRLVDSRVVDVREGEAVRMDVLPAVYRWMDRPDANHGLLVRLSPVHNATAGRGADDGHLHVRLRRHADPPEEESSWQGVRPLLFTYTDDSRIPKRSARSRRSSSLQQPRKRTHNRRKEGRTTCQRHNLYVDFGDVGWNDWIVAPPGYDAYYCHGDCPFPLADHLNSTNHAIVQTLVHSVNPSMVPKACCVPTQLSSISMLYTDEDDKVVLKNYQDMTVLGCGCR